MNQLIDVSLGDTGADDEDAFASGQTSLVAVNTDWTLPAIKRSADNG